jgi:methylmalonyl-CoA mutase
MSSQPQKDLPTTETQAEKTGPVRFVTATSLFDGHDASINIIRRFLQREGAEVVHLGHNRPVHEVVIAALQEDAHGIAISSYQGGHNEYFKYTIDLLKKAGASHIKVFGGGGGVIVDSEIKELMAYGVERIYSPDDGRTLGLEGMARDMIARAGTAKRPSETKGDLYADFGHLLARKITEIESEAQAMRVVDNTAPAIGKTCVLGFTGSGGAGKSSLIDEFLRRFKLQYPNLKLALLSVDPTQRKTGGALLGDRLRLNSVNDGKIFMRSLATRTDNAAISSTLKDILSFLRGEKFDLIVIESAGIGQSDTAITDLCDFSVYVMTPEYGAATQLEKIAMLDYANMVIINKSDRVRAEDALIQVRKQYRRNHALLTQADEELPIYPTIANRFGDQLVDDAFAALVALLQKKQMLAGDLKSQVTIESASINDDFIPAKRTRYLSEIADAVRGYHKEAESQAELARQVQALETTKAVLGAGAPASIAEKTG